MGKDPDEAGDHIEKSGKLTFLSFHQNQTKNQRVK